MSSYPRRTGPSRRLGDAFPLANDHLVKARRSRSGGLTAASGLTTDPNARRLRVESFGCAPVADLEPHSLGLTYWFDAPEHGAPLAVKIRFNGRRIGVKGKPRRGDTFDVVETLDRVVPGSGPVAITTRVSAVTPGEWHVTATAHAEPTGGVARKAAAPPIRLPSASSSGSTGFAPVIRVCAPGARLGAWPALVGVGVIVALVVQFALARGDDLPAARVLLVSLIASLIGLVAAKVYYLAEHRREGPGVVNAGLCIQGFVLGAIAALAAGSVALDVPVGGVLDASTPGLLFAMAIGRFGCFFGGCCAGRPTGSRWGLWSSDRRLGLRRIPTQLLESALAFAIGVGALAIVTSAGGWPGGTVFVAAIAVYTFGRQLLFPLRDLPRNTHHGRIVTVVVAAAVAMIDVAFALLA